MTVEPGANAAERRRWNDTDWTSAWLQREQVTAAVTGLVLARLAPHPSERVLEIGSGGGGLSLAVAHRVSPAGVVVGVDISARLVRVARARAAAARLTNVSFVLADAQTDSVPGAPFDTATSQFGVMFFDEPVTAFANMGRHLDPGGRLVFACWQGVEVNPWHIGPVLAHYLAPALPPPPGKSATGPFSMGDPDRVGDILRAAGWGDIERTAHERTEVVGRDAIVGGDEVTFAGVAEADMADARAAIRRHLARFELDDGRLELPLAFQIFAARRR
jgi:SAM-dependent methyltransferase